MTANYLTSNYSNYLMLIKIFLFCKKTVKLDFETYIAMKKNLKF